MPDVLRRIARVTFCCPLWFSETEVAGHTGQDTIKGGFSAFSDGQPCAHFFIPKTKVTDYCAITGGGPKKRTEECEVRDTDCVLNYTKEIAEK